MFLPFSYAVQVICMFLGMGVALSAGKIRDLDISRRLCRNVWLVAKCHWWMI